MSENIKAPYFDGTQPCAQIGGDLFFPETAAEVSSSKQFLIPICGSCEFNVECLEYALTHSVEGIWAGTSVRQRQELRTQRNLKVIPYEYSRVQS
jgi:hypothetical protein